MVNKLDCITGNDIKNATRRNNIDYWYPFNCAICGCNYGFYFENGNVIFNGACDCGSIFEDRIASYDEIAELYNTSGNEKFKNDMRNYFKF